MFRCHLKIMTILLLHRDYFDVRLHIVVHRAYNFHSLLSRKMGAKIGMGKEREKTKKKLPWLPPLNGVPVHIQFILCFAWHSALVDFIASTNYLKGQSSELDVVHIFCLNLTSLSRCLASLPAFQWCAPKMKCAFNASA